MGSCFGRNRDQDDHQIENEDLLENGIDLESQEVIKPPTQSPPKHGSLSSLVPSKQIVLAVIGALLLLCFIFGGYRYFKKNGEGVVNKPPGADELPAIGQPIFYKTYQQEQYNSQIADSKQLLSPPKLVPLMQTVEKQPSTFHQLKPLTKLVDSNDTNVELQKPTTSSPTAPPNQMVSQSIRQEPADQTKVKPRQQATSQSTGPNQRARLTQSFHQDPADLFMTGRKISVTLESDSKFVVRNLPQSSQPMKLHLKSGLGEHDLHIPAQKLDVVGSSFIVDKYKIFGERDKVGGEKYFDSFVNQAKTDRYILVGYDAENVKDPVYEHVELEDQTRPANRRVRQTSPQMVRTNNHQSNGPRTRTTVKRFKNPRSDGGSTKIITGDPNSNNFSIYTSSIKRNYRKDPEHQGNSSQFVRNRHLQTRDRFRRGRSDATFAGRDTNRGYRGDSISDIEISEISDIDI
eukprot:902852_1